MGKRSKAKPAAAPDAVLKRPRWRVLASVLLILHLVVVVATPMAMIPPRSILAARIVSLAAPYVEAGNISNGYAFFAPDPGPAHLIEYRIELQDGTLMEGTFPDPDEHWPRLRYHRHFMLSEQLGGMYEPEPPRPPETAGPQAMDEWKYRRTQWQQRHAMFQARGRSFARHLLLAHHAQRVELQLIRHDIALPQYIMNGGRLTDKGLYMKGPVFTYTAEDLP